MELETHQCEWMINHIVMKCPHYKEYLRDTMYCQHPDTPTGREMQLESYPWGPYVPKWCPLNMKKVK